jgi:hypothetical protein
VIFGTAVMARRTGRRDRGVREIPGTVADRGAGVTRVGAGLNAGGAGGIRGTHAPSVGEGRTTRVPKGINELNGKVLKTRVIY